MSDTTEWQPIDGQLLETLNDPSFKPKAKRASTPPLGYLMTTELCHLSCVMCHFNGPKAARRGANTLDPGLVIKILKSRPRGERIWFVSTGEFFNDPNALAYTRAASELGLRP